MENIQEKTEQCGQTPGLYDRLLAYGNSDFYPFHMPGHKRRLQLFSDPYAVDITEIEGFDNLHHAEGILLEAQRRAARLYGAEESFFLVNGSTCGILAAVSAATRRGGKLLMARNCHKAAYHAVLLQELESVYLYPQADMVRGINGAIDPESVRSALKEDPGIGAVLITSPTYDGVASDVRAIAGIVHEAGGVLIVDEAHGAHFGMHPYFPEHSIACGADLVINSVHKTLPALTQTALLHVQGPRVDRERLRRYLGIYQTSSPSYVLMAGIDRCVRLLEEQGETLFESFAARLAHLRRQLSGLQTLHLVDGQEPELYSYAFDRSKLLISTEHSTISGAELCSRLREQYHLEMEMEAAHYVTAIATIADTDEGLSRLAEALLAIDEELTRQAVKEAQPEIEDCRSKAGKTYCGGEATSDRIFERRKVSGENETASHQTYGTSWPHAEAVMRIAEAEEAETCTVPLAESNGQISAEFAYLYPPGIPLLVPGERITEKLLTQLHEYQKMGLKLQGLADYQAQNIRVITSSQNGEHAPQKS